MSRLTIEIKKGSTQKIWVSSDTHYGHKNICRGVTEWRTEDDKIPISQTRDFETLEKMNDTIVNNINSVVGQDDIFIHDGDWSFGGIENIWNFRKRIICKNIYLILGNHDHHVEKNKILPNCHLPLSDDPEDIRIMDGPWNEIYGDSRDLYFSVHADQLFTGGVYDKLILTIKNRELKRTDTIYFDHHPSSSWEGLNKGWVHLHGHVHLPHEKKFSLGRRMDIGIDGHPQFRPYELYRECLTPLYKRDIESGLMRLDHHIERLKNSR